MVQERLDPRVNKENTDEIFTLVLLNDDVNTFDYVIQCLIEICGHQTEQAEQCAMIAHYKGKSGIKSGTRAELAEYATQLSRCNISTQIIY